jgi:hypothetical protein
MTSRASDRVRTKITKNVSGILEDKQELFAVCSENLISDRELLNKKFLNIQYELV